MRVGDWKLRVKVEVETEDIQSHWSSSACSPGT